LNILSKSLTAFLLAVLFLGVSCTTSPEIQPPSQTRILRVEVEPNPVMVGDTATFTCIIEDSLDERFRFAWNFGFNSAKDTVTEKNWAKWKAPDTVRTFNHTVNVSNGSQDSLPASRSFNISVVDN